jgi:hypothetical protein
MEISSADPQPGATVQTRRYGQMVDEPVDDPSLAGGRRCCFYGWLVWVVLVVAQIITFFGTSSGLTFIIDDVMDELHLSRSSISLACARRQICCQRSYTTWYN